MSQLLPSGACMCSFALNLISLGATDGTRATPVCTLGFLQNGDVNVHRSSSFLS